MSDMYQIDLFGSLGEGEGQFRYSLPDFLAKLSALLEREEGLRTKLEAHFFFEILRWASILEPEYLLLENVEGLLSHDEGRTFTVILSALAELGYDAEWCVLNSAAWVPQNRERVFIVASLRGKCGRKVFPFGGENRNSVEVIGRLDINGDDYIKRVYSTNGIAMLAHNAGRYART